MPYQSTNTEQAQLALGVISDAIQLACHSLADKKMALELQHQSDQTEAALSVINIRLDTLLKLERYLIAAVRDEYVHIEQNAATIKPADLPKIAEARNQKLIESMVQGL